MRKLILVLLCCCLPIGLVARGLTCFLSAAGKGAKPLILPSAAAKDAKPSSVLPRTADAPKPSTEKQILFVCTGNYYRSRYAQACFNLKAQETQLGWKAVSRGFALKPGRKGISPLAAQELSKRGVPEALYHGDPEPLTEADLNTSDYIVLMDEAEHRPMIEQGFPKRDDHKIHYWKIPDYPSMTAPAACAAMSENIDHLLKELAAQTVAGRHQEPLRPSPSSGPAEIQSSKP
jgi:protein-tyrosine phosphatase